VNIVEPSSEYLTIAQALQLASGVSDKMLRRALQQGELPRRYVMVARGPQLVFTRAELDQWLARRKQPRRRAGASPAPTPTVVPGTLLDTIRQLQAAVTTSQAAMAALAEQLAQHNDSAIGVKEALDSLAAQLASVEHGDGDGSPSSPVRDGSRAVRGG
jgi:predicted DNA-binding transcriptional regulator AlpA